MASRDSAKTAARRYENILSVGISCVLYQRLDGILTYQSTRRAGSHDWQPLMDGEGRRYNTGMGYNTYIMALLINSLFPGTFGCDFLSWFTDWYHQIIWTQCPQMNTTETNWWWVNIGSGNGLVPSCNKPLPEPVLTQFIDAYVRHCGEMNSINSLAPRGCGSNFKIVFSEHMSRITFTSTSCEIVLSHNDFSPSG